VNEVDASHAVLTHNECGESKSKIQDYFSGELQGRPRGQCVGAKPSVTPILSSPLSQTVIAD
jgi:hypothetical protein